MSKQNPNMRKRRTAIFVTGVGLACGAIAGAVVAAGIPATNALYYAGVLDDGGGGLLNGSHNFVIELWDAPTAGQRAAFRQRSRITGIGFKRSKRTQAPAEPRR